LKRIVFACEDDKGLNSEVSMHFGRCPYFLLVDIEEEEILKVSVIKNPYFENHVPGKVPQFIKERDAHVMIAGGMGHRAVELFNNYGIEVATGAGGKVEDVLKEYLAGRLKGVSVCEHDHNGRCN